MSNFSRHCMRFSPVLLVAALSIARADDTEVFFSANASGASANVLLILDTSGSMDSDVKSTNLFDPTVTYSGGSSNCTSDAYYFVTTGTTTLTCSSTNLIPATNFKCAAAVTALSGAAGTSGMYTSSGFIRWAPSGNAYAWNKSLTSGSDVECKDDEGVDGDGINKSNLWPDQASSGVATSGSWTATASKSWFLKKSGGKYTIYTGNYINWYNDSSQTTYQSKLKVMQDAVSALLNSVSGVNVGVMRYDANGSGGTVLAPVGPLSTGKNTITNLVNSWAAAGSTPLSESLYEAYLYFSGGAVHFGKGAKTTTCTSTYLDSYGAQHCSAYTTTSAPSVAASRSTADNTLYDSPADSNCQKNYVIFLTDGQANEASTVNVDPLIAKLPDFKTLGQPCDTSGPSGSYGGLCLAALAKYMNSADLRSDVSPGKQNVTSYFIGFGPDFTTGANATAYFNYLSAAASAGGSDKAYTATSLTELTTVFSQIFAEVQKINTTFTAPAVTVNAFDRTETLDDLYMSVFSPKEAVHWPGNVKKYKLVNGEITDANGLAAVDASTGFTKDSAHSYWTSSGLKDGAEVRFGGAAENIPAAATRTVYTFVGTNPIGGSAAVNLKTCNGTAVNCQFDTTNTLLTASMLGITGVTGDPTLTTLIQYSRGQDVDDVDKDKNTTEQNSIQDDDDANGNGSTTDWIKAPIMGDPIHTQPAVVIYGTAASDTIVYTPTNDGYLHAVRADTGQEIWSFIPQEMLSRLRDLYVNDSTVTKNYGLDGSVRVLKYDVNNNGKIDAGTDDRVLIYFGTGRSTTASAYYALDVTDPYTPKLQWVMNSSALPGLGQAWSTPSIGRLKVAGTTQNSQHFVLFMGGGYDASEDGYNYVSAGDAVGTHVYMVDALFGTLLWSAGGTSSSSNFKSARMDHSIPSPITSLDINGNGFTDRLYFGDMAGQLWRIDLNDTGSTTASTASTIATGGVIASLGSHEETTHTKANNRRFYSAPDVAEVRMKGVTPYLNLAIGSGYRGHPLDDQVQDRLYGVRDYNGFASMTQTQFNALTLVLDSSLTTTSTTATAADGAPGWKIPLNIYGWIGEKSIVAAKTNDNVIYFTTYTPNSSSSTSSSSCTGVGSGTNRIYQVNLNSGLLVTTKDLAQGGIASEVTFTETLVDPKTGKDCTGTGCEVQEVIFSGQEKVGTIESDQLHKTYWRDTTSN